MKNVEDAVKIAEYKYPARKNTLVFIFDQSSCHKAFAEDALNATRMNLLFFYYISVKSIEEKRKNDMSK